MSVLAGCLLFAGAIIFIVGGLQFLIAMFQKSVWWGLAHFFIPLADLVFLFVHFREAWPGTRTSLVGAVLIAVGAVLPQGDCASWRELLVRRLAPASWCDMSVNGGNG
jgi:hypothetical protein